MKILLKYFKPFTLMLILAIFLLFVQAYTNLALPDYMSDIVNVGIQQGGINNTLPTAVSKTTMDKLLIFTDKNISKEILDSYTILTPDSPASAQYTETYPALSKIPVYVLKDVDPEAEAKLSTSLGRAWLMVERIENPNQGQSKGLLQFPKLPAGTDPFAFIKELPVETKKQIFPRMEGIFKSMDAKMIIQAASIRIRKEYSLLGVNTSSIQTRYMFHIGFIMLFYTLIGAIAAITTGFLAARIAAGFARDLRTATFERIENFSAQEFNTFSTASLITRSTNDIMQIQMITVMLVSMVFYAPIIGIGGIIRAMAKSSSMWWIIALVVVILLTVILTVFKIAVPKFKLLQQLMDKLNLVSRESLSGMLVIRAFNMQNHEEKRFDEVNKDLTKTMLFVNHVMVVMMPIMILIMNALSILIIWVGAKQVAASTMQVGDMMAFMQYAMQIVFAFLMLSMMFIMVPRAAVSAGRVAEVLNTPFKIVDPPSPKTFDTLFNGTIVFNNVSFRYPGAKEDALHKISFTAARGETTAIIGTTGSGKSTLVNLIPRFYDVTDGTITVGDRDVQEVSQHDLRERIAYIPQKSVLFSGTIKDNLKYPKENADTKVLASALTTSQAKEFVDTLEDGILTNISQGGTNVSGGQKQRISIARALVKQAPVYIFDDSFSALDFKTDAALRRALQKETSERTLIIVAQRVSTIKNAHQIIVLDEGKLVGKGTHSQLMAECHTYREIATTQLSMEELA